MEYHRLYAFEALCRESADGYWKRRIVAELAFLLEHSLAEDCKLDGDLLPQIQWLLNAQRKTGAITKEHVLTVEKALAHLGEDAKSYHITCCAHAHIDMNWMWGYQETAALTVDTFRTMLDIMKEYPTFTFSQSQASVYQIIEEYCPAMLDEIRERVKEGRWEVTASTWVENDKNMSGGETMARHLLYTRRYLSELLDLDAKQFQLDFEPDTFGHPENLPEILAGGGIRYYYHCRGVEGPYISNWKAPSGAQLLVYREPTWYNQAIEYDVFSEVPAFCRTYGTRQYLKVYGVGDHGGGPTRRDLDRLLDMASWPLLPTICFGTLYGFFRNLEKDRANFPTVEGERNYVFTGCYTSQSRIKRSSRLTEERLAQSELLDAMAALRCPDYRTAGPYESAWRKVLFNQFHDILPGSGKVDTREFAMGEYQRALATASINANHAMRVLCGAVDTSAFFPGEKTRVFAASGVGFGTEDAFGYGFSSASSMGGEHRVYTLFNTTQYDHSGAAELVLWDWPGDPNRLECFLEDGTVLPVQVLETNVHYWTHHYLRAVVALDIPAYGYCSVGVRCRAAMHVPMLPFREPRVDRRSDDALILENTRLRAAFDPCTMSLLSLLDKTTGEELVDVPSGLFVMAQEETSANMTSWRVGHRGAQRVLNTESAVTVADPVSGAVRRSIPFTIPFGTSCIQGAVRLDGEDTLLRYDLTVDWREFGSAQHIPQLSFCLPLAKKTPESFCPTPMGWTRRPAIGHDVPCLGMLAAKSGDVTVGLLSDCKYGFRNDGKSLSVTLLRSSFDPDQTPETGLHPISLGIALGDEAAMRLYNAQFAQPPVAAPSAIHPGILPAAAQLLRVLNASVSAVKQAEQGGLLVRLYNPGREPVTATVDFACAVADAYRTDFHERPTGEALTLDGNRVTLPLLAGQVATVMATISFPG